MKRIVLVLTLLVTFSVQAQQLEKLQQKAASGNTEAMIELAICYETGYGLPVDTAQALELYRRADAMGNADAKGHLSRLTYYYSGLGHDAAESFRLAQASADAGSAYGTYRLGVCYLDAIGVERDRRRAHEFLERAADKGCDAARDIIARSYLVGRNGYARDIEKGFKYAKKMKDGLSYSNKYRTLSQYYFIKGDTKTALEWINKGIAVGNVMAMATFANYMEDGVGMPTDEAAALAEYRRLKEKFHGSAYFTSLEANLLLRAEDTAVRNRPLALQLFKQIGDERGYDNYDIIGLSYIYGYMTPIDTAQAYSYWLRGVRKDDDRSMVHLAQLHNIWGNEDSMYYYLFKAYELESAEAAGMLAQIVYGESPEQSIVYGLKAADWGDEEFRTATAEVFLQYFGDEERALECYDRAIANHYIPAYIQKANYYLSKEDEKHYYKTLEEGGKNGCTQCYSNLGYYYQNKEEYKKAVAYYEKAGTPEADFRIAVLYLAGDLPGDSAANTARGLSYLRRSAAADYEDALYWLGINYQQQEPPQYDSANLCFEYLSDNDYGMAQLQLGINYELGRGVPIDTVKAMYYYGNAGDNQVSIAYTYLGDLYLHGCSEVPADDTEAFHFYALAATMGDDNALGCLRLAKCYLKGVGINADTASALYFARTAAEKGIHEAMSIVGDCYYYGWGGLTANSDTAYHYYYLASQGDDPRGDYMIGDLLFDEGLYDQSLQYILSAVRNGNVDALVAYARALWIGAGVEENGELACELLETAAPRCTTGMPHFLLGYSYLLGHGRPEDHDRALQYFDTAISLGNINAMLELGSQYLSGEILPRDTVKGLGYFERAVDRGSVKAMMRLASGLYRGGDGFPHDAKRAAELFQRAADRGSLDALCRLGLCYEEGEGVILNSRKAYNLYLEAAERGSAYGMFLVAMCYAEGVYVQENMEQAAEWFLKGAEAGDVKCAYFIGRMYAKGEGVKKNKKEAKRWLTIALENGIEAAEQDLKNL